ncbi:MAG: hypothetical protein PHV75_02435 [Victivallaceae bacterium]|nr:hypothetical protein [Victivallaceae bacterium]
MKIFNVVLSLLSLCATSFAAGENAFPKTYKTGNLLIDITGSGVINLKYKDSKIIAVQNVWFMNEKWRNFARKTGDILTVDVLNQDESAVDLKIKDIRQDFLKSFEEQVKLTEDSLYVSVDYEYSADIGQWHWPVYLFAENFTGRKYRAKLADGTSKEGIISEIVPDKIIYGLDNNNDIKELTFCLEDFDLKFTFMENGWNLCDHRSVTWTRDPVLMLLNSTSGKKKGLKEHYSIKISIQPKKN